MIFKCFSLHYAKQISLKESVEAHVSSIFEQVLMVNLGDRLSFEIDDADFTLGDVENDHLILPQHSEKLDNCVVRSLK